MSDFLKEWDNKSDFIEARTSGSTGTPKTIKLKKADMMTSAMATNAFFGISRDSVLAIPLSSEYIAGKMMAVRAIAAQCRLIELPVSNSIKLSEHVNLLAVVPSQIPSLLDDDEAPSMVRNLLIGGAPLDEDVARQLTKAGFTAYLGYGMTETCSHVALRRIGAGDDIFHAMPGITFDLDARGCLVVNSQRFSWRTLVTNDMAELVDSSSFRWLGRFDNVVNSGGIKLHPEILEREFREQMPWLPPFFLMGENDDKLGQRLIMIAEKPDYDLLERIRASVKDHRKTPKRIVATETLPRTNNGKISRVNPENR